MIDLLKEAQEIGLGVVDAHALSMKHFRVPPAFSKSSSRGAAVILELVVWLIVFHGLCQVMGNLFWQREFLNAIVSSFQQPNSILRERQHIETTIIDHERQERFEMELIADKHLVFHA